MKKFAISTAPFRDYVPVIRYAEVLLNCSEAAAKLNDINYSVELLKAVRNRSNPNYVFPAEELQGPDKIIETIITERRIELLGEGFRLMDLQRLTKTLPQRLEVSGQLLKCWLRLKIIFGLFRAENYLPINYVNQIRLIDIGFDDTYE